MAFESFGAAKGALLVSSFMLDSLRAGFKKASNIINLAGAVIMSSSSRMWGY